MNAQGRMGSEVVQGQSQWMRAADATPQPSLKQYNSKVQQGPSNR